MSNRKTVLLCSVVAIGTAVVTATMLTHQYSNRLAKSEVLISANQKALMSECKEPDILLASKSSVENVSNSY